MEPSLMEHRLSKIEDDIKVLYNKTDSTSATQIETTVKLDHILIAIGELKEHVASIQNRPSMWWDKLIVALIGALSAAFVSMVFK